MKRNRFIECGGYVDRHRCLFLTVILFGCLFSVQTFSQLAKGHEKFLGNVYGNSAPPGNWDSYWNQVTPENSGKWQYCETSRDGYSLGGLDNAYNYAKQRGIPFKDHTLIWGQQYPVWIDNLPPEEQLEEVEEWIKLIGERYPDMDYIDVVNEPLHAPATFRNALGGAGTTGWDWVIWCFEKARQYIPDTKLILNDYGIINDYGATSSFLQIINLLKDRGLIDGIGVQGHRFELESGDTATFRLNLDRLAETGLPVYITEFDLGNIGNSGTPDDNVQLELYKKIFPVLWEHPGVEGITLWGYIQGQTWQTSCYLVRSDGSERPALQWLRQYLSAGNYQSHQSGNWNDIDSWEWHNGTEWVYPAPAVPSPADNAITILDGHTITITESDSADQLFIGSEGTLAINTGVTFLIKNGQGADLVVNGTVINSGSIIYEDSAEFMFLEGSKYIHQQDGGAIPPAFWGNGSTCEITGAISNAPSNSAQNFYNFVWNCPGQTANLNVGWQNKVSISGTLTVTNTNWNHSSTSSPSYQFRLFGASGSCTINNIVVNGFNAVLSSQGSAFDDTVIVNGDITLSNGGMLSLSNNSGGVTTYLVKGDLTVIDSAFIGKSNSANTSGIRFSGSGTQNLVLPATGVTFFGAPNIEIADSSVLNLGESIFSGSGSFRVPDNAAIWSGHIGGLNGNITCTGANGGGNLFSKNAYYRFNGTAAQVTGSFLPDTLAGLTIDNSSGVTLLNPVTINDILELKKGALITDGNKISYGPDGTLKYSGTLTQTTTDIEFPEINGPVNLIFSNPSGVTLHASKTITGNVELEGKLNLGDNSLTANTATNTGANRYVVTDGEGALKLTDIGTERKYFPVGITFFSPVWITNSGVQDIIGVNVEADDAPAPEGGRIKVRWNLTEETPGGGDYDLEFGWVAVLEDNIFKTDREFQARIFDLTDTVEAGSGDYAFQFVSQPYSVGRGGISTLGTFGVGRFGPATGIEDENVIIPQKLSLDQNYPNPFNPSTVIRYTLPKSSNVKLTIYDILGVKVKSLLDNFQNPGEYIIQWNATNEQNKPVASGVYLYRLETGDNFLQKKMILMR